ncbi:MAG: hypothetical protein ABR571_18755 [Jatrophihabitans sp.]|uniref:hypothetical protein n=1 Tax=Jatrophihabitans sp. TaxID=1932789 RepID=UPI00390DE18D
MTNAQWSLVQGDAVVMLVIAGRTIGGCLVLGALFQGSSRTSESIQPAKYPDHPGYQRTVPRFLPWPKARLLNR